MGPGTAAGTFEGFDYSLDGLSIILPAGTYSLGLNTIASQGRSGWDNTLGTAQTVPAFRVVIDGSFPPPGKEIAGNLAVQVFGRAVLPPPADRDGDGVPDDQDLCPDVPGDPANNGCPSVSTLDLVCPSAKSVDGCGVEAITGLPYSETFAPSTLEEFRAEGGEVVSTCGVFIVAYRDSSSGTCPVVVTRTFAVSDYCGLSKFCEQIVTIRDQTAPAVLCPLPQSFKGCQLDAITPLSYSESPVSISLSQFSAVGGGASDDCGIASITYQDTESGSCPTVVVTRTFIVVDVCGNVATCSQTISSTRSPELLSDLTVLSGSVGPSIGGRRGFYPSAVVSNLGQAPVRGAQVRFELSGGALASSETVVVPNLDPGATLSIAPPRPLLAVILLVPSGSYTFRVTIDPNDRVAESNESNNALEQQIVLP